MSSNILYYLVKSGRPLIPQILSDIDKLDDRGSEKFWFRKDDLFELSGWMLFSETIILENRSQVLEFKALCVMLRQFATKLRSYDLVAVFGRDESTINRIFAWCVNYIYSKFTDILKTFDRPWLTKETLDYLAQKSSDKGYPFPHCIGYLDGTLDQIFAVFFIEFLH